MDVKWLIGILSGVVIFALGQLGILIWFLSGMSNNLRNVVADVKQINIDMKSLADQDKRLAVHEERHNRTEHDVQEIRREMSTISRNLPVTLAK